MSAIGKCRDEMYRRKDIVRAETLRTIAFSAFIIVLVVLVCAYNLSVIAH